MKFVYQAKAHTNSTMANKAVKWANDNLVSIKDICFKILSDK